MFDRFDDRARRVVVLAQEEARLLGHGYIGTEHILLGLIHEGEGTAATILGRFGISLELLRTNVAEIGPSASPSPSHMPFSPRAKSILELALREAIELGHDYIGTEHILLGVIREGEGIAVQLLRKLGVDPSRMRDQIIEAMSGASGEEPVTERIAVRRNLPASPPALAPEDMPACSACRAPLARSALTKTLDVPMAEGAGTLEATFIYCGQCGLALGVSRP